MKNKPELPFEKSSMSDEHIAHLFRQSMPVASVVDVQDLLSYSPDLPAPLSRRWSMKMKIRTMVIVLSVTALISLVWLLPLSNENVAWAQVREAVSKIRTVTYVETRSIPQDYLKKQPKGIQSTIVGNGDLGEDQIRKISILGKHLERNEYVQPDNGIVYIRNLVTGEYISIQTKQKRFVELVKQVVVDRKTGTTATFSNLRLPKIDLYAQISRIPDDATERLPVKKINGKKVVGFRKVEKHEQSTWTNTYWIDATTKLPVRIETSLRSTNSQEIPTDWVRSDFVFNKPLDKKMFDMTPPVGYKVIKETVYGFR